MTVLGDPLRLGGSRRRIARNRIVFGPHETNLGRRRAISERHVAYYRERAAGGAGIIVTEEASVHMSDWPYERSPLAADCAEGWAAVAAACQAEGALVVCAIGHAGGQGSSAYHQQALWAPSRTPDIATRETPVAMSEGQIAELVAAFAESAGAAVMAGADGVEVNAGQWSLLRQYLSGLTNQRSDRYGEERSLLLSEVLAAVRQAVPESIVGLRVSCDELAPWAGLVPDAAIALLADLPPIFDYVTIVRGSAYGTSATRPDGHVEPVFNRALAAAARAVLPEGVAVVAQGSIVDVVEAESIVSAGDADAVEMTRAQIADPSLAARATSGRADSVRPCVLCNQMCQVRDARNPIVSCIGEPRSGHEAADPALPEGSPGSAPRPGREHVVVVGAGPAGLECARVAALFGRSVIVFERAPEVGGAALLAARLPGRSRISQLTAWMERECRSLGVEIVLDHEATLEELDAHEGSIVCCTGSKSGRRTYDVVAPGSVVTAAEVLAAGRAAGDRGLGPAVVWDPIGGPIGVGVAELLARAGDPVSLVTPDMVAGEQLAMAGDLAPANVRLAQLGVEIVRHAVVRSVDMDGVEVEDRFGGGRRIIEGALLVDAGHRLPDDGLYRAFDLDARGRDGTLVAGDAVAPRSIHEAVLEGRRAGLAIAALRTPGEGALA